MYSMLKAQCNIGRIRGVCSGIMIAWQLQPFPVFSSSGPGAWLLAQGRHKSLLAVPMLVVHTVNMQVTQCVHSQFRLLAWVHKTLSAGLSAGNKLTLQQLPCWSSVLNPELHDKQLAHNAKLALSTWSRSVSLAVQASQHPSAMTTRTVHAAALRLTS